MTEEDIKTTAFLIWRDKKRINHPDADNAEKNWQEAKDRLWLIECARRGEVGV